MTDLVRFTSGQHPMLYSRRAASVTSMRYSSPTQSNDDAGEVVATHYITVFEYRFDPASPPADLTSLPRESILNDTVWLVAFTQDSRAR